MGHTGPWARAAGTRASEVIDDGISRSVEAGGRIERFDAAVLQPQSTELGGFILIQGSKQQINALRTDVGFQQWVTQIQLVADRVGIVDAWVNDGLGAAFELYEEALRKLD